MSGSGRPGDREEVDIDALIVNREYIRYAVRGLAARAKLRILDEMNRLRSERKIDNAAPAVPSKMTAGEVDREILWRLDTLPSADAGAIAKMVRELVVERNGSAADLG